MIKQIYLKNFQSHKETTIDLVNGINTIVGLGQAGKSAIIRAINLLINNRPLGFRYHSNFSKDKETIVRLTMENNDILELIKTKNKTIYKLNNEEYSCVGSSVPEEIKNAINMNEINIASQFDNYFLICDSPGQVAKTFNQITNIEDADNWIFKITNKINSETKEIRLLDEQLSILDEKINKYNYLEKAEILVKELILLEEDQNNTDKKIDKVSSLLTKHNELKTNLDQVIQKVVIGEEIHKNIDSLFNRSNIVNDEIKLLEEYISKKKELQKYNYVYFCDNIANEIQPYFIKLKELKDEIEKIDNLVIQIKAKEIDIIDLKKEIDLLEKEYIEILKENKKCPVCNNMITNEVIDKMEDLWDY